MSSSSDDDESYGPALPPHMLAKKKEPEQDEQERKDEVNQEEDEDDSRGRSHAVIGPSLPPGFKLPSSMTQPDEQVDDEQVDLLPTSRMTRGKTKSEADQGSNYYNEKEEDDEDNEDDEDDMVGPYPPDHPKAQRSYAYRLPPKEDSAKPKREEWMLVPPKNKPISGLAARKFLPRSLETRNDLDQDNDEDNEEQDLKEHFQAHIIEKRDELMSNLISESKSGGSSDRSESLLAIHRKNIKRKHEDEKKKKKAGVADEPEKKERRAFDRDTDLSIRGMNEDDKQRFIKRSTSELQGRFSHGKRAGKFL